MAKKATKSRLKVIPLGGMQEIGRNITAFEYCDDIIIADCGVSFPEDEMLGVDLVIPDFSYLIKNKEKVRGVFLTHGHEDHIGAIPYLCRELSVPIHGTRLTLGLVELKLQEHRLLKKSNLVCLKAGEKVKAGNFEVEFIATTHSIADSVALAIDTPAGMVIHSGDFKIDHTPIQGAHIDLQRFAELGRKGVLLFLCESTNVEMKGYTMSERTVGTIFNNIFSETPNGRILIATFSSNIDRIQQIINAAVEHKRKIVVVGRSMLNTVKTASELGYLTIPDGLLIETGEMKNYTDRQIAIITTGSQGEAMSALTRMAFSEHKQINIKPGDKVVISASSIPGNEKSISKVINELMKKGTEVVYEGIAETHVSGHARQEELKMMHALIAPKFLLPIHGEYRHRIHHKNLAVSMGMHKDNVFIMNNGEVLELSKDSAKINGNVPSGLVMVDGLGVGDVGNIVLRDRKHLSQDGLIIVVVSIDRQAGEIVSGPDLISRGFVYVRESEDLMDKARTTLRQALAKCEESNSMEWSYIKSVIKNTTKDFVWEKTKRSPMILPIIVEG